MPDDATPLRAAGTAIFNFGHGCEFVATATAPGSSKMLSAGYQMNRLVTTVIFALGVLLPLLVGIFVLVGLN